MVRNGSMTMGIRRLFGCSRVLTSIVALCASCTQGIETRVEPPVRESNLSPFADPVFRLGGAGWRHGNQIFRFFYLPSGEGLLSMAEKSVRLWDPVSRKGKAEFLEPSDLPLFSCGALSGDGRYAAVGTYRGRVYVIRMPDCTLDRDLTISGYIAAVGLSHDGSTLATLGWTLGTLDAGSDISIWDIASGVRKSFFLAHEGTGAFLAISPTGDSLVSTGLDRLIKMWDWTGKLLRTIGQGCGALAFSPNGKLLAVGSEVGSVQFYDPMTGDRVGLLQVDPENLEDIRSIAFNSEGNLLACSLTNEKVGVWQVADGKELFLKTGLQGFQNACAFSRDGRQLVSGGARIHLWQIPGGEDLAYSPGHEGAVESIIFAHDPYSVITVGRDQAVKVWDLRTGIETRTFPQGSGWITSSALSPDGRRIVLGWDDGTIRVMDATTGVTQSSLVGLEDIRSLAWSPDGSRIAAVANLNGRAMVWNAASGEVILPLSTSDARTIAFLPTGKQIVVGLDRGEIHIWNVSEGKLGLSFSGHKRGVKVVFPMPDGRSLCSVGYEGNMGDGTIRLWDLEDGKEFARFGPIGRSVYKAIISPDGRIIAAFVPDGGIHLYETWSRNELRRLTSRDSLLDIKNPFVLIDDNELRRMTSGTLINAIAFSRWGDYLACAQEDGAAVLWKVHPFPHEPLNHESFVDLWDDLVQQNIGGGAAISRFVRALQGSPSAEELKFLRKKLMMKPSEPSRELISLLESLEDDSIDVRDKGSSDLMLYAESGDHLLITAMDQAKTPETRIRLRRVLHNLALPNPRSIERLARLRAIWALELADTPSALDMLDSIANEGRTSLERDQAKVALTRSKQKKLESR